ncbi:MAG: helix-turn-helix domain-containing protein, partial [Acidobacteriota bacterium]|nr:helix-turn-helix domain-containing protein [Acidobacteriota bacterium]
REAVAARQFREDLYFRLSVFPVEVPALRERREDIPKLAHHFVERVAKDVGRKITLSPEAVAVLMAHDWPGNIRELQNALERAVILADGETLLPRHLSLSPVPRSGSSGDPWERVDLHGSLAEVTARAVGEVERRKVQQALLEAGGDRGRAADLLQINYKALEAKMRELKL